MILSRVKDGTKPLFFYATINLGDLMYEINNLSKDYSKEKVLNNLKLRLPNRGLVIILGESGSGKTTLFNILALLDTPTKGSVYYNNEDIIKYDEDKKCEYRKNVCSLLYQKYHLIETLTVKENILLTNNIRDCNNDYEKYTKLLKINDKLDRYPNELSGGEQQRVALARTLVVNSPVILADEPTGALDSINARILMDVLKEESKTKLVLVVTHNKKLAQEYGDRIVYLDKGKIEKIENKDFLDDKRRINKEYKQKNIKNKTLFNWTIKSVFKRRRKYIACLACYSLCLAGILIVMGLKNGLSGYCDELMTKRLDYSYINVYCVDDGYMSKIDQNILDFVKNYDVETRVCYDQILNSLSLSKKDDYYEVKVIDGEKIYVNEMFYETFKDEIDNLTLSGQFDVAYESKKIKERVNIAMNLTVSALYYEGELYNVAKIYIPRKALEEYFKSVELKELSKVTDKKLNLYSYLKDYAFKEIYTPLEIKLNSNEIKDTFYEKLMETDNTYPKYTSEELEGKYSIVETGDEMLRTTFFELLDSGELVLLTFMLTLIFSVISLISLMMVFSIKEREKEFGIIRSYGGSKKDIAKLVLMEEGIFSLLAFVSASIVMVFTKVFVYMYSDKLLSSRDRVDLIISKSSDFSVVLLVLVFVLVIASISPIVSCNKQNIVEVVNDD